MIKLCATLSSFVNCYTCVLCLVGIECLCLSARPFGLPRQLRYADMYIEAVIVVYVPLFPEIVFL